MFKQTSLSMCLCLMAVVSNCLFAAQDHPAVAGGAAAQQAASHEVAADPLALVERGQYMNREGFEVHRPAHTVSGQAPAGASAQCRDGSYSFSMNRRGTCSRHGGVSRWI